MVKLQERNGQYTLSIPKEKVMQVGWKKGDTLAVDFDRRTSELIIGKLKDNITNNNI